MGKQQTVYKLKNSSYNTIQYYTCVRTVFVKGQSEFNQSSCFASNFSSHPPIAVNNIISIVYFLLLLHQYSMGAPTLTPTMSSSRPPQPQQHRVPGPGVTATATVNNHYQTTKNNDSTSQQHKHELENQQNQSLEATYTSLIQEYLQVMCLDNATFLAERMVASCQTTNAYYLLGVCHYRSNAPQRALSVLANNIHQSSTGGGGTGTKYHHSATAYLMAKCCFDLQQYGRAEEALLEAARADYKEYKSNTNRNNNNQGNNNNYNKNGNNAPMMAMDEWLMETSPCPIPNGAAGLYLLGNICRRSNRRRRAMEYYRMSLQVRMFNSICFTLYYIML